MLHSSSSLFFFFNDTATTEIYTLSLHDVLPISDDHEVHLRLAHQRARDGVGNHGARNPGMPKLPGRDCRRRSEEHTSELQSPCNLVCRLLLEKKKRTTCQAPHIQTAR